MAWNENKNSQYRVKRLGKEPSEYDAAVEHAQQLNKPFKDSKMK